MGGEIKLTEYSHGAGCGCKISPDVLDIILQSNVAFNDERLLVGNASRDDAAVYEINKSQAIISTTDFFMPIVDDPFQFGRIAATNAISDVYAMGGTPIMAIAILGWPIDKLPAEVAQQVVEGGRQACKDAGIALAGGHSIDAPEPIFGLAVTGEVSTQNIKRNDTAKPGDKLYLTKPLGIGILTTAEKKKLLQDEHRGVALKAMCQPNYIGTELGKVQGVTAMTDVTGFGLLGHLNEMCQGSGVGARIALNRIAQLEATEHYRQLGCIPGGTERNYQSYSDCTHELNDAQKHLLCDPQTSGGLLVAVSPDAESELHEIFARHKLKLDAIVELLSERTPTITCD